MTDRPAYEALKKAFSRPLSTYADGDALASDCAEMALEALEDIISESELDGLALGDSIVRDVY